MEEYRNFAARLKFQNELLDKIPNEQNQKINFLENKVNYMEQKEIDKIQRKKNSNLAFYNENGRVIKDFFQKNSEEILSNFIGLVNEFVEKKISFQGLDILKILESLNFPEIIKSYLENNLDKIDNEDMISQYFTY